jgi:hypothetical protein
MLIFLFYTSCPPWDDRHMLPWAASSVEMRAPEQFFPQSGLISASQVARNAGIPLATSSPSLLMVNFISYTT